MMIKQLDKVLEQGYISSGWVASLTSYFAVPKGEDDIWVVYNSTGLGLNELLWSPSFWLPNSSSAVQRISFYKYLQTNFPYLGKNTVANFAEKEYGRREFHADTLEEMREHSAQISMHLQSMWKLWK
jgi:hypothetical protein